LVLILCKDLVDSATQTIFAYYILHFHTCTLINFERVYISAFILFSQAYLNSEGVVGRLFEGRRQGMVLASKFGYGANKKTGYTALDIEQALTASLERLRTDYLDLYQVHWPTVIGEFLIATGFYARMTIVCPLFNCKQLSILLRACIVGKILHCIWVFKIFIH